MNVKLKYIYLVSELLLIILNRADAKVLPSLISHFREPVPKPGTPPSAARLSKLFGKRHPASSADHIKISPQVERAVSDGPSQERQLGAAENYAAFDTIHLQPSFNRQPSTKTTIDQQRLFQRVLVLSEKDINTLKEEFDMMGLEAWKEICNSEENEIFEWGKNILKSDKNRDEIVGFVRSFCMEQLNAWPAKRIKTKMVTGPTELETAEGLIAFGVELESGILGASTFNGSYAEQDEKECYVKAEGKDGAVKWMMFNDDASTIEFATEKGHSLADIRLISKEIHNTWQAILGIIEMPKEEQGPNTIVGALEKGENLGSLTVNNEVQFMVFGKQKKYKTAVEAIKKYGDIFGPQFTLKLPVGKIPALFEFLASRSAEEYTCTNANEKNFVGKCKMGIRQGRLKEAAKEALKDLKQGEGYDDNARGLGLLWHVYRRQLFTSAANYKDYEYGPKQDTLVMSRISFYEMHGGMEIKARKDFYRIVEGFCDATLSEENCEKSPKKINQECEGKLLKYQNKDANCRHVKFVKQDLTLWEWSCSIVFGGGPDYEEQDKYIFGHGKREPDSVQSTDKLSPPPGFRSSEIDGKSDYKSPNGAKVYGMGGITGIPKGLALLELRAYADSGMTGKNIQDYVEDELTAIYNALIVKN